MMNEQLDFFDVLYADERKANGELCSHWIGGVKNDNGVYTVNTHKFVEKNKRGEYLELNMVLHYPYIYGEIDFQTGAPDFYGRCCPLTEENPQITLNVFDDEWKAECELTEAINAELVEDKNLEGFKLDRMLDLVKYVVKKAMEDMGCRTGKA